jgi:hypothetical protein
MHSENCLEGFPTTSIHMALPCERFESLKEPELSLNRKRVSMKCYRGPRSGVFGCCGWAKSKQVEEGTREKNVGTSTATVGDEGG